MSTTTIATYAEAVQRLVVEPLGEWADDYDISAIADEVLVWYDAYDATRNAYWLPAQGYRYAPAYDSHSDDYEGDDAFWRVVARHDLLADDVAVSA